MTILSSSMHRACVARDPGRRGGGLYGMRAFGGALRGRRVEAATQREIKIDALHERVASRVQQRRSRSIQRDVLSEHGTQVARAHAETDLRELDRAAVVRDRAREYRLPFG